MPHKTAKMSGSKTAPAAGAKSAAKGDADETSAAPELRPRASFQDLILRLQTFWGAQGCAILQPYDMEVGAGTFHPATTLRALGPKPWAAAYVQPSRRPKDGRYGENPNRLQHYYQFQVIMKPSPAKHPGVVPREPRRHRHRHVGQRHPLRRGRLGKPDTRRLGLGLGSLVQRHGSFAVHLLPAGRRLRLHPVSGEITYGLERLAMYVQGVNRVFDLNFNGREDARKLTYGDIYLQAEQEYSRFNFEHADTGMLLRHFKDAETECKALLDKGTGGRAATSTLWRSPPMTSASRRLTSSICSMPAA